MTTASSQIRTKAKRRTATAMRSGPGFFLGVGVSSGMVVSGWLNWFFLDRHTGGVDQAEDAEEEAGEEEGPSGPAFMFCKGG